MHDATPPELSAPNSPEAAAPPKPQRRRQEERVRDTREKILNATIEVLVRDGFRGLSLREVAAAAEVSYGALVHHFTTKDDLTVQATSMVYEQAISLSEAAVENLDPARNPVSAYIDDCVRLYFDSPFIAALEILMSARSDKPLLAKMLPVMTRHRSTCDALWHEVFTRSGMDEETAARILNLTLNIIRGMALNRIWKHDDAYYQKYLAEWTAAAGELIKTAKSRA